MKRFLKISQKFLKLRFLTMTKTDNCVKIFPFCINTRQKGQRLTTSTRKDKQRGYNLQQPVSLSIIISLQMMLHEVSYV